MRAHSLTRLLFLLALASLCSCAPEYYEGRRVVAWPARYWGYLRTPGAPWRTATLTVVNERNAKTPDRLPEAGPEGARNGQDHNHEYKLFGSYSKRTIYDPNTDLFLPEFILDKWEEIPLSPGFNLSNGMPHRMPGAPAPSRNP
jgi:hypothetical protein